MKITNAHFLARLPVGKHSTSLLAAAVMLAHGSCVQAQPTAGNAIEEVIVTALKREQNIQDVGVSITAVNAGQIKQRALQALPEISKSISNIQLFEDYGGHGMPTWVIRGVGLQDFNANNTSTAAVYVDEIYQVSNVMGGVGLFDAERVEVLKGPQGGFYGRNTSGGAINLRTQRPEHGETNGYAGATYSSWQNWNLEAAGNVPVGERATLRIAGNKQFSDDAWQRSLVDNQTWGERDLWNARSWLLFDPGEDTRIQWKLYGGENNSQLNLGRSVGLYAADAGYCAAVLSGVRDDNSCYNLAGIVSLQTGETPVMPGIQQRDGSTSLSQPINQLENDYAGSTLIIDHDFNDLRLSSITNFESFNYGADMDFDGTPLEFGHNLSRSAIDVWSQEVRVATVSSTPLSWMAGAYISKEKFAENREFRLHDSVVSPLQVGRLSYDQETDSFAMYGNVGYRFTDALKFNATVRYTNEEKSYRDGTIIAPAYTVVEAAGLRSDYRLNSNWSGNAGLEWQASDELLVYSTVSRGFKAGGFFGGFPLYPGATSPYKEETVIAYELGFKSQLADNLILNGATFFYDYRDVQGYIVQFSPLTESNLEFLSNQGDAEHSGAELEVQWGLTDRFSVTASGGYLDASITDSKANSRNLQGELVPVHGRRPYAPLWSANAGMQYRQVYNNDIRMSAALDYDYRTDFAGNLTSPVDQAVFGLSGYGLFNGSVFFTRDDWTLGIWGKNLADKVYVARVVYDSFGDFIDIFGEPRSWGVKLEKSW